MLNRNCIVNEYEAIMLNTLESIEIYLWNDNNLLPSFYFFTVI